ncbi:MAG TPA: cysteine desulfurase-like protein [Ktedonobacteraceae bacterium]|nr:cysteine desulfurase-like protein [Ktedonobacteraceae bacterium]
MPQPLDLSPYRVYFPALAQQINGQQAIYFDNPGGTQVASQVIDAMVAYFREANANTHGAFATSHRTDEVIANARGAMADFLHAASPNEIVFGPNMTTLTFAFSRAIGKTLQAGDEIVVTVLDHDANVAPWLALQERGVVIRTVDVHAENTTLDMQDLLHKINERTKVVAVGYASNATGGINDVATIIARTHEVGALAWIDAVQFAPHAPIDVQQLDADFLVCSSYKFFGPHLGILYGKAQHLETFPAYKVRPASNEAPDRWETGTQNHEGLAGLLGAMDYLAMIGREQTSLYNHAFRNAEGESLYAGRQRDFKVAMQSIMDYERGLSAHLLRGLREIKGIHVYGITDPQLLARRVPTVICTIDGHTPRELAELLASQSIFAWDGNYYAPGIMERLHLEEHGGALRLGMAHYNTTTEIDRVLTCLETIT